MKKWITILLIAISLPLYSQNDEIDLEIFAERLFQVQDEDVAYEDIYESLLLYYSNKLNLNLVEPEELASLYILNPAQLSNFFTYRDQFGNFLSINELQAVPELDLETIRMMLPFVTVEESRVDSRPLIKRILTEENNYFLLRYSRRLEEQKGYTAPLPLDTFFVRNENNEVIDTLTTPPSRYAGSPNKIYGRFRTSHRNDFSLGFTFEKDNGEEFAFNKNQKGFDFYSYHLMLENKFGFEKIMLGDFQLQVGQGIVFGAGFNAGKGAETVNTTKRNSLGIRPYTSVLESGFFRGVGLTKKRGDFEMTLFYSDLKQDGNVQTDTTFSDFDEFINSIQSSGFHRTPNELNSKDRINEQSVGAVIQYQPHRRLIIGVSGLNSNYSRPLQRKPNNYNQFEFKGDHNFITSAYANYTWQNFTFFGEGARSKSGGIGAVAGLVASLSRTVDMAMVFRNYDRDFHSFYGNAFSENSRNINERGTYWGLSIKPNRRHKLNLYYDRFKFPWLKFRTEAPSVGNEWLIRYSHFPSRQITLYAQARQQKRQVTMPSENLNILTDQIKYNYIFNIDYELKPWLKLKTKVQSSTQQEGNEHTKGFAIIQDVNFEVWKLKFNTRMALFDTDDFDNAQYVYENDVLYAFSIPAYNGTGVRSYAMVRYDPIRNVSVWLRYAQFSFRDREVVGSGLNESIGNTSSEMKIMLRIKF
ncbi:Helix-hairpin-helix motif-containing protein [Ekhidna lutea]|uniref:Helix-hairpin-helix motif-containing protein n=1 Tax=Ekhidna lutea TaxID=447679 RepID=A0A239M0W8_EKHLU|nr:helix-hairpin-helix domain-containing protein [Ekhidna lutea]SNT35768.1 Helix-hairpin-helix motif-containing protein [Ekhidna lutea]